MTRPVNPYVAGNPVGDSPAFVGRMDVLREVQRVLRRPQDNAIVLYGQRRIGKTSILQHLAAWLPREGTYRPIYFDLQDKAAWPLGRVLRELARTVAHTLGIPEPDLGADPETAFRQDWLPTVLGRLPDGSALVLLFDEFDVLADPKEEQAAAAFFPYLRGLLTADPQRLKFVFVIGRNVNDLSTIALSIFKGTPARRVSLLSREDTADLVRLSEANNTLRWPVNAIEHVWQWTHGHAFLTQQLCSHVWEQAHDGTQAAPSSVIPEDVDAVVSSTLDASRNTLEWLWNGLPPAERVVISALAEAGPDPITQEQLEHLLRESGVRVVIRELQNAPQLLQDWDLIEPANGGYRYRVELLRRWIAGYKPLRRVQEELDRIEPAAENLYRAALGVYRSGQLEQATGLLRQTVSLNPNHVGANQLLADILLAQGQTTEARQLLERLFEYQPAVARPRLTQVLLAQAEAAQGDERLALYERVLSLDLIQPEAIAAVAEIKQEKRRLLLAQAKAAQGDEQLALYERVLSLDPTQPEAIAAVAEIKQEKRRRELAARLPELETLEQAKRYQDTLNLARKLANEYPDLRDWSPDVERLERKTHLAQLYQRVLGALQSGDRLTAQALLAQLIALEPAYEQESRYLHWGLLLSTRNPLDHLRLLWWLFLSPQRLKAYQEQFGEESVRRMRMWLASTLICLPIVLSILLMALSEAGQYYISKLHPGSPYLTIVPALAWLLIGRRGDINTKVGRLVFGVALGGAFLTTLYHTDHMLWMSNVAFSTALRGHEFSRSEVAFSPDGRWLARGGCDELTPNVTTEDCVDNTVRLWDVTNSTAEPVVRRGHEDWVVEVAFSPDGRWLASAGCDARDSQGYCVAGTAWLWDLSAGAPTAEPVVLRGHEGGVLALAFSPDGRWLASGSDDDSTARLWDVTNPTAEPVMLVGYAVAFSPDGRWRASGSDDGSGGLQDGTARLWDMTDLTAEPIVLRGHEFQVRAVVFSPDGRWLATEGIDGTARLWDMTNLTAEPVVLRGREDRDRGFGVSLDLRIVAFSPDGRWLATGSGDRTARRWAHLWDVSNPTTEPVVLRGHEYSIQTVAFSPDGRWLVTGSWDGTTRLWDPRLRVPSGAWLTSLAAFAIATGIGFVVAFSGPVRLRFGAWLGVVFSGVVFSAAIFAAGLGTVSALFRFSGGVLPIDYVVAELFSILGFVVLVLALIARRVSRSLETGRPSWLARGAFGAVPVAYLCVVIIYLALLGAQR